MAKKLTPKQKKFVEGIAGGKTQTEAYKEAYDVSPDTKLSTVHENASRTASLQQVDNALKQLFSLDKTKDVVDNLHKLATSAEDQKIQVDATKEWLSHAVPKEKGNTFNNFGTVVAEMKDKYAD